MALFGKKLTTLEEVKMAYKNLSDKDKQDFHQSIADRIHESIGEQEHDEGQKDNQSAEDREHEALGEEHVEGNGDVSERHGKDDADEKTDGKSGADDPDTKAHTDAESDARQMEEAFKPLREELAKLTARLDMLERMPQKADDAAVAKLSAIENRYNN